VSQAVAPFAVQFEPAAFADAFAEVGEALPFGAAVGALREHAAKSTQTAQTAAVWRNVPLMDIASIACGRV
jgi:hypothetical protein